MMCEDREHHNRDQAEEMEIARTCHEDGRQKTPLDSVNLDSAGEKNPVKTKKYMEKNYLWGLS